MTRICRNPIVLSLAAAILAAACRDDPIVAPRTLRPEAVSRSVSLAGGTAFMLSAEVCSDAFKVIYYDLPLDANGASAASLTLPTLEKDAQLQVTLRAHDQYGETTHQGGFSTGRLAVGSSQT